MHKVIDYYFSPMSPWTYLGHARFAQIAQQAAAAIHVKPVDYGKIFSVSGGLPLAKRAAQRQAYRLVELQRWREFLDVPLNLHPKFFPVDAALASQMIVAARARVGDEVALKLAGAMLRACWVEERNLAEADALEAIAIEQGLDGAALMAAGQSGECKAAYDGLTQEAVDLEVFGAPTYVYRGELFWGQDRLDFLARAVAR